MKVLAVLCLLLALGAGQTSDRQLSFDSRGEVFRLSPGAGAAAAIFPDIAHFSHAELWQTSEGIVLEVSYADRTRERRAITEVELADIREHFDAHRPVPRPGLNQSGRGSFLLQQIPLALAWYGPAVTAIVIPHAEFRWQTALSLGVSSAAFFAPLWAMRNMNMSEAQAHLCVANGLRGIFAGYLIADMFKAYESRVFSGIMVGTSVAGQVAGYHFARDLSLGQATLVTAYTDIGLANGALLGAAFRDWTHAGRSNISLSAWSLAGLIAGGVAGNLRAPQWDCTEGQVAVLRTGSLLGALVPTAICFAFTDDLAAPAALLGVAGCVGGTILTERAIRSLPLSTGNGYIVAGMTIGGALLGAGGGVLTESGRVTTVTASVGAVGGMIGGVALARNLHAGQARSQGSAPRIGINYAALLNGALTYNADGSLGSPNLITIAF